MNWRRPLVGLIPKSGFFHLSPFNPSDSPVNILGCFVLAGCGWSGSGVGEGVSISSASGVCGLGASVSVSPVGFSGVGFC